MYTPFYAIKAIYQLLSQIADRLPNLRFQTWYEMNANGFYRLNQLFFMGKRVNG